eukprot:7376508-Prymnesium_polylepis.1
MTDLRGGRFLSTTVARRRSAQSFSTATSTAATACAAAASSADAFFAFRRASFASFAACFFAASSFAMTLSMSLPTRRASLASSSPI